MDDLIPVKEEKAGRLVDGTFAPGVSGHPEGRPKRKTLTELIHAKLDSDNPDNWDALANLVIAKIFKGKDKEILINLWDRTEGKPTQKIELDNKIEMIRETKKYVTEQIQSMAGNLPQGQAGTSLPDDKGTTEDL